MESNVSKTMAKILDKERKEHELRSRISSLIDRIEDHHFRKELNEGIIALLDFQLTDFEEKLMEVYEQAYEMIERCLEEKKILEDKFESIKKIISNVQ